MTNSSKKNKFIENLKKKITKLESEKNGTIFFVSLFFLVFSFAILEEFFLEKNNEISYFIIFVTGLLTGVAEYLLQIFSRRKIIKLLLYFLFFILLFITSAVSGSNISFISINSLILFAGNRVAYYTMCSMIYDGIYLFTDEERITLSSMLEDKLVILNKDIDNLNKDIDKIKLELQNKSEELNKKEAYYSEIKSLYDKIKIWKGGKIQNLSPSNNPELRAALNTRAEYRKKQQETGK
ncbi:Uncharacterised protein [Neisseria elongata]|uniref:Uncharacterized protein n=1 Tax=Neisseria elongata TaxID=495 RepID=A0A378TXI2_NEIEL|nr:hypothetical protein [Neisseria elongata]SFH14213.1 hypothetical protein SAMN05421815_11017 [Neisseria elongata subsp. elongata]STZ67719.1 Uncharacterised protein [Neisseria elongata]